MRLLAVVLAVIVAGCVPVPDPCPDCPSLVRIPGGVRDDGTRIAPFLLARSEVTFDQWTACVADGVCREFVDDHGWGRGARPVINVTVADAEAYAAWLSLRSGRRMRLPTVAEWQWAALGGGLQGGAVCRGCGTSWDGVSTAPAGSVAANGYGLSDMRGNVWELTASCWPDAPVVGGRCAARQVVGGAWYYQAQQARADAVARHPVGLSSYTVGFRVAADAD